jgi:hypothetical protein
MNAPKGLLVDHENGDKLDNRRANLRFATNSENQCNRRKTEKTSSQYKGVCLCPEKTHWYANIKHKGNKIWLGSFKNEIDAAKAYDRAAIKYFGKFARLNFSGLNASGERKTLALRGVLCKIQGKFDTHYNLIGKEL